MSRFYPALILPKLILPILLLLLIPIYAGTASPEPDPDAPEAIAAEADLSDEEVLPASADSGSASTLLVFGYNKESRNIGSLLLVRLDKAHSTLRIVRVKGSCYVRDPACPDGRLSSAYAEGYRLAKADGADEDAAKAAGRRALTDILEKTLGVRTDGSISLDFDAFCDIIDRADGVDVELPRDFTCSDSLRLTAGKNHLDGKAAERFVRSGKPLGEPDGEINPRRIFLSALFKKIKHDFSIPRAISLGCYTYRRADTDLKLPQLLSLLKSALSVDLSEVRMADLLGAAVEIQGVKLQVLNRNWARDLVNYYLDAGLTDDGFDPGERLTDPGNAEMEEIYRGRAPGMNGWGGAYNIPSVPVHAPSVLPTRLGIRRFWHKTWI